MITYGLVLTQVVIVNDMSGCWLGAGLDVGKLDELIKKLKTLFCSFE